jgi:hypothetical protein
MSCSLENFRRLEAAQGYAVLGLYMEANKELEQMTAETRHWPEALAIKLAIFSGLRVWELAEVVAAQLRDRAQGNPLWLSVAEEARKRMRAARLFEPCTRNVYPNSCSWSGG